jgi:hypothetical protein
MPTTAASSAHSLPRPLLLLLLVAALLYGVASVERVSEACPSVPTLSSNCSAHDSDADWCILSRTNGTGKCFANTSTGGDDCSWRERDIVAVDGLPFDCEKLCVLRSKAAPPRASLTLLSPQRPVEQQHQPRDIAGSRGDGNLGARSDVRAWIRSLVRKRLE